MARQRRVRLRDLIANANATVNQASGQIQRTSNNANEAIDFAEALMADIKDGMTIEIERVGDNSIMDFVMGKCDKLPIRLKINIEEDDETVTP